jgi:hypothetical protein
MPSRFIIRNFEVPGTFQRPLSGYRYKTSVSEARDDLDAWHRALRSLASVRQLFSDLRHTYRRDFADFCDSYEKELHLAADPFSGNFDIMEFVMWTTENFGGDGAARIYVFLSNMPLSGRSLHEL